MVEAGAVTRGIDWRRPPASDRIVLLLGAFDPPTVAHVGILEAASTDRAPAWGMTRVLLDRPAGGSFPIQTRIELVDAIAARTGAGFALFEGGTYLDVHRALVAGGIDAVFLIGSDKLAQLRDPAFYPDGQAGVDDTFASLEFLVVDRDADALSASKVRRMIELGQDVADLVPPEVVPAIADLASGG